MNVKPDEFRHAYDRWRVWFRSASLSHSLIMATAVGMVVAAMGVALFALSRYLQIPWQVAVASGGVGQVIIVSALLTLVLEQRRKRLIRQAREFNFLNHHIRNAITQMTMASYLDDLDKQQRIRSEALGRISGALRRIATCADLSGLSLDVDLTGAELVHEAVEEPPEHTKRTA